MQPTPAWIKPEVLYCGCVAVVVGGVGMSKLTRAWICRGLWKAAVKGPYRLPRESFYMVTDLDPDVSRVVEVLDQWAMPCRSRVLLLKPWLRLE